MSCFFLVCFWLFLISDGVLSVLRPAPRFGVGIDDVDSVFSFMNSAERLMASFSFWTIWSNYMLVIFFTCVLVKPHRKINFNIWTIMTGYMTLTMMLFWMGLAGVKAVGDGFQTQFINDYSDPLRLTYSIILHLLTPGVIIGAWIYQCGKKRISWFEFTHFYLPIAIGILVIYMIFVLTRGTIRMGHDKDIYTSFPYFFFAITVEKGIFMLSISIVTIVLIMLLIFSLYFKINNIVCNKNQVSETIKLKWNIKGIKSSVKGKWVIWSASLVVSLGTVIASVYFITKVPAFYNSINEDDFKYNLINYLSWSVLLGVLILIGFSLLVILLLSLKFKNLEKASLILLLIVGGATVLIYGVGTIALGLFLWGFYSKEESEAKSIKK
ncbi:hypothetical protein [Spiroplasma endosymbiont of Panorpa germanica]|uniref:hypothetical protein n=1 Tax=Spiroplasma endosymbiont of Panorpa germanica TaxID=3066314 RepID=UPI0030CF1D40